MRSAASAARSRASAERLVLRRLEEDRLRAEPQVLLVDDAVVGEDDGALEAVAQLADVPRPVVRAQALAGGAGEPRRLLTELLRQMGEIPVDERVDVLRPLAERGNADREDADAVEEVFAEEALGDELVEGPVRRRDDPDVDLDRDRAADPVERALLEHAQELGLRGRRQARRSRRGRSCRRRRARTFPCRRPAAPVNEPRSWPKSSLSSSVSGIAAQLMATNAPARRGRELVDRAGEELLARAALALEQDRRVGRRDALRFRAHGADRGRLSDDRRHRLRLGFGEEQRFARARPALDRPRDEQPQQIGIDRLGDEVFGAALHRLDRRLDRAERRHHDAPEASGPGRWRRPARPGRRPPAASSRSGRGPAAPLPAGARPPPSRSRC